MPPRTVFAVLDAAAQQHGDAPALYQPTPKVEGPDKYRVYSWNEWRRIVIEIACGLRDLGVQPGEMVALHSETRAEFYFADIGVMTAGAIAAALYTSSPLTELARNIRQCGARTVLVEDARTMAGLMNAAGDEGLHVRWILLTGTAPGVMTLDDLRTLGREALERDPAAFDRIRAEVKPSDTAILYFTSGATGEPKMGMVSHQAITLNLEMGPPALPVSPQDRGLAFLPSAHIAQRLVMEFLAIRYSMPVWFSESLAKLPQELKAIRPTFVLAPPRVWERIYSSIRTEINKRGALTQRLFHGALGLGLRAAELRSEGRPIPGWMKRPLALADRIIFSKLRERLGGGIKYAISGAAPLGRDMALFYEAIGMPLLEGYGLTEGGVLILNPLDRPIPGTIGKPLQGVEVSFAEDGELLIKSPTLFDGYYQDPEATRLVMRDGWLHTGDIAEMDANGYISITGRKKEMIVASNGKKIYPSRVETLFKSEPIISQILLIGDRLPYVTALITVNPTVAESLKGMESLHGAPLETLSQAEPVQGEIRRAVQRVNQQLADFEKIRKFRVLDRDFSIDTGELTPTMKVRRKQVLENFRGVISELYVGKEESH